MWNQILKIFTYLLILSILFLLLLLFQPFSKELRYVDPDAHKIAARLLGNSLVTKRDIKIYVGHSVVMDFYSLAYAISLREGFIYLSHRLLDDKYLDIILAHEIGHIECDTARQDSADFFGAKLVGKQRMIDAYSEEKLLLETTFDKFLKKFNVVQYTRKDGAKYLKNLRIEELNSNHCQP